MTWGFLSIYVVIAIIMSVGASVAIFLAVLNRRVMPDVLLFYVVATLGSVGYLLTTRQLNTPDLVDFTAETWLGRLANIVCLAICLVAIVRTAIQGIASAGALILAVAALQYYFVCFLMPVSFDRWFVFDHKMLYPLAALFLVTMPRTGSVTELAVHFGRAASMPALCSLLLLVVNYDAAVLSSYQSLIPGFEGRLFGAASHPNVLGTVCAFAILLLTTYPPKRRAELILLVLINLVALILCQSKTSWATLVMALLIVHAPRATRFSGRIPAFVYVVVFLGLAAVPAGRL